jgi:hypothetical protein
LEDTIRIPPDKFGEPIEAVGHEQLKIRYEGMVDEKLGYVIAVTDVQIAPVGKVIPGDGATYHRAVFSLLVFYPKIQEIVEGEIEEVIAHCPGQVYITIRCTMWWWLGQVPADLQQHGDVLSWGFPPSLGTTGAGSLSRFVSTPC